ncbi:MAG: acylphosphatase [Chloroflexota bacterium]|nr:acylphosphatase [Chloroflexota bacterium]MDE2861961.1 acylphosphatase [Chloroflexota bacterium]MDE2936312.1 acylphosphatase [Chloroflexota bacterium]MXW27903.1 acylphosphatase [Chloroflexota bacterium]MXX67025.1 acylphosphatase [Chloroflexota bacterium]
MATRRLLVLGRVQQVGYRAFVLRRAGELGLSGHVRNTADGRVEVIASGPASDLDRLEEFLRDGPPLAVVAGVESTSLPERNFQGFQVLA